MTKNVFERLLYIGKERYPAVRGWWSYRLKGMKPARSLDIHEFSQEENRTWLNPQTFVRVKSRPERRNWLRVCVCVGVFRSYPVHTEVMSAVIKASSGLILRDGPCLNTTDICLEMTVGWERKVKFWVGEVNWRALAKQPGTVYLHRLAKQRLSSSRHQLQGAVEDNQPSASLSEAYAVAEK